MRGLILFDWDSTVVDDQSQINDPNFHTMIQRKIQEGWLIGLNSDTPFKRLYGWWQGLGMNGPIVAERGAVIWWPGGQLVTVASTSELFSTFRQQVLQALIEIEGFSVFYGDSTLFVDSVKSIQSNDSVLVIIDGYRLCSLALFVRRIVEGRVTKDLQITQTVCNILDSLRPSHSYISEVDLNREHCYLCINTLDTNKAIGVQALLQQVCVNGAIYMIGDSMSDHLALPQVQQLAVGNASIEYKSLAHRVARHEFAKGCVELLSNI